MVLLCKCCFPKIIAHNTTTELPRMKFVSCHCISLTSWPKQCTMFIKHHESCSSNSWLSRLSSGRVSAHRVFGWTQRTPKKHFRVMQWEKPGISAAIASSHLRPCRRYWYGVMGCHGTWEHQEMTMKQTHEMTMFSQAWDGHHLQTRKQAGYTPAIALFVKACMKSCAAISPRPKPIQRANATELLGGICWTTSGGSEIRASATYTIITYRALFSYWVYSVHLSIDSTIFNPRSNMMYS